MPNYDGLWTRHVPILEQMAVLESIVAGCRERGFSLRLSGRPTPFRDLTLGVSVLDLCQWYYLAGEWAAIGSTQFWGRNWVTQSHPKGETQCSTSIGNRIAL